MVIIKQHVPMEMIELMNEWLQLNAITLLYYSQIKAKI